MVTRCRSRAPVSSSPANGSVVVNPDGTLTYTPDADFFGSDAFTYTATDGTASVIGSVTVTVAPVNDAPLVTDDPVTVAEDSVATVDVLVNDADADGDSLTVAGVSSPANGSAVVNPDGTVTYTPDADFFGTDSFTYTATDGTVGVVGSVMVTVTAVNDPPTAPGVLAVGAGVGALPPPLPIGDPEGGVLTVTVIEGSLPPGLTLNSDGTWSGEATEQGTFVITVEICDEAGACTASVLSISVALLPATGVPAVPLARLGLILVLLGWAALRFTTRPLPEEAGQPG
jgi:hypothetical protein